MNRRFIIAPVPTPGARRADVDIASVLIAMYRAQGIPARYAVGKIITPQADVANWLAVKDNALCVPDILLNICSWIFPCIVIFDD